MMTFLIPFITALALSLLGCYLWITWMVHRAQQPIRTLGPTSHAQKRGTPTGGGIVLILSTLGGFFATPSSYQLISMVFIFLGYGALGAWDDATKILGQSSAGVSPRQKFLGQLGVAAAGVLLAILTMPEDHSWFSLDFSLYDLGKAAFIIATVVGSSNGVNLTDGLDGLAIGLTLMTTAVYAYLGLFSDDFPFLDLSDFTSFHMALLGASLGFLVYNKPPKARLFMGDVGSLPLGAVLAWSSFLLDIPWLFALMGGVFVIETLSVILQVFGYRRYGRRLFRMAPLHHHFEHLGWSELRVVLTFWIAGAGLNALGLWLSLKC